MPPGAAFSTAASSSADLGSAQRASQCWPPDQLCQAVLSLVAGLGALSGACLAAAREKIFLIFLNIEAIAFSKNHPAAGLGTEPRKRLGSSPITGQNWVILPPR